MKIDPSKKYRYRNGEPARILCVDAPGEYPVIAIGSDGDPTTHNESGQFFPAKGARILDLIEIREPREWTLDVRPGTRKVCKIYQDGGPRETEGWERIRVREVID